MARPTVIAHYARDFCRLTVMVMLMMRLIPTRRVRVMRMMIHSPHRGGVRTTHSMLAERHRGRRPSLEGKPRHEKDRNEVTEGTHCFSLLPRI